MLSQRIYPSLLTVPQFVFCRPVSATELGVPLTSFHAAQMGSLEEHEAQELTTILTPKGTLGRQRHIAQSNFASQRDFQQKEMIVFYMCWQ